jgi:hypothetical protein
VALAKAQAGALRDAARQLDARLVSPNLDFVFLATERKVDFAQRDGIIFGQPPTWSEVGGGVLPFRGLTSRQLDSLIEAGGVVASDGVVELSRFLRGHRHVTARGFVVSPSRGDTRVEIEGVDKFGKFTAEEKKQLRRVRSKLRASPGDEYVIVPISRRPGVRSQALRTIAAELDASTRSPLDGGVRLELKLSEDDRVRDKILFGRPSTEAKERFDTLTVEDLQRLLELNLCDPAQRQNYSPTTQEIAEHMLKFGGYTAFGFVCPRAKGGIVIEGVEKEGSISDQEQRAFRRRFKQADAIDVSTARLYCWFD